MPRTLPLFALATLGPALLIALGAVAGGLWIAAALAVMAGLATVLDRLVTAALEPEDDREFPAATGLSRALAIAHLGLAILVVRAVPHGGLTTPETIGLILATGLWMGQVSHANAHELIHSPSRLSRRLGIWVYISILFGHHASAHPLVHHVHVATRSDPSTARLGESYYRFAYRAWTGSFVRGLLAERARLARAGLSRWHSPYVTYVAGAALVLLLAWAIGGTLGLATWAAIAALAQSQILMSDYVQHYGLARRTGTDGKPEPVGLAHSWNSPHPVSSALLMNAPRHSDHHAHPQRSYPALRLRADAPMLPRGLPAMAALALWPPAWRRVMDPRVARLAATPPPSHGGVTSQAPGDLARLSP